MVRKVILNGLLAGVVVTLPLLALFFVIAQLTALPVVPFEVFNWIARVMPGPMITFGIDAMIDTMRFLGMDVATNAKIAEQIMAFNMVAGAGIVAGMVYFIVMHIRKRAGEPLAGVIAGLLLGLPIAAIVVAITQSALAPWIIIVFVIAMWVLWGLALNRAYAILQPRFSPEPEPEVSETPTVRQVSRRQFLIEMGAASAAITVAGSGVGLALFNAEKRRREGEDALAHEFDEDNEMPFPNSNDPLMAAPGTRPEYTPLKDHYSVFLATEPSVIEGASWTLPIMGLVNNPLNLTLDDIRDNYMPMDQYITMSCISGRVGTGLISTTLWTGVPVRDVLADADLNPNAQYLDIMSEDGFHEIVDLSLVMQDERIMFCYAWDGHTLPVEHGFPLRIYIPDRYGMKQPKWITSVDVVEEYREGYWVERGWSKEAIMNTTSVIDTVAVDSSFEKDGQTVIPVGGIAHAGARGISKVEVRVDGGAWEEAALRSPLSETTWVVWRYDWPFEAGSHLFEVRCAAGDGTPQSEEAREARPDGSTGIHSITS